MTITSKDELRKLLDDERVEYRLVAGHETTDTTPFLNQILREIMQERQRLLIQGAAVVGIRFDPRRAIGLCISQKMYGSLSVMTQGQDSEDSPLSFARIAVRLKDENSLEYDTKMMRFAIHLPFKVDMLLQIAVDPSLEDWQARASFGDGLEILGMSDDRLYQ